MHILAVLSSALENKKNKIIHLYLESLDFHCKPNVKYEYKCYVNTCYTYLIMEMKQIGEIKTNRPENAGKKTKHQQRQKKKHVICI